MENSHKVSTKQYVYSQVAKDIITGVYSSDTIITEKMLLNKYDVSRVSVREALIELCKDHYLRSIPRTGYMLVTYTLEEIINILDFRSDLEVCNLRRGFPKINESKLNSMGPDFLSGYRHPIGTGTMADHWSANTRFHLDLCSLSGNKYVYEVLENLMFRNSSYYQYFYQYEWNREYSFEGKHSRIIKSLFEKDIDEACNLLVADINDVKLSLLEKLK